MRPHRITIEAMGPFAEQVTVDFDDLAEGGLFLIHGPTGSGKTSLFDALCFALYGEVPGHRGERSLLSHHATTTASPQVSLEFTAQGGRYRVVRTPYHEAPRKRGTGTVVRQPTATLVRLDPDGGVPTTVSTKATEVKAEIHRLVGLTASQFQQVILLPQGQFEAVLRGRPETREALLKTLFHTIGFERTTDWLVEQAKEKRQRVADRERELTIRADEALRRAGEVLAAHDLRPAAGDDTGEPTPDQAVLDQAALDGLAERARAALDAADAAEAAAAAVLAVHQATAAQVTAEAERWDRHHRATADRGELLAAAEDIDAMRAAIAAADQAHAIRPSLDAATRLATVVTDLDRSTVAELARVRTARDGLLRPIEAVDDLDLGGGAGLPAAPLVGAARRDVAVEQGALEAARRLIEAAAVAAGEAAELRAAHATALGEVADGQRLLDQLQADQAELADRLAHAATARDRLAGLTADAERLEREAAAATRLQILAAELGPAEADLLAARDVANTAWAAHLDLRSRYLDGIAAVLADGLEPGDACAVCGSTDHPHLAAPSTDAITQDQLDQAERATEAAHAEVTRRNDAVTTIATAIAAERATAGDAADDPLGAAERAATAAHKVRVTGEMASQADGLRARRDQVDHRVRALDALLVDATAAVNSTRTAAEAAEDRAAEARAQVAIEVGPGADLDAGVEHLAVLDAALQELDRLATTVDEARQQATAALDRLEADVAASPFASLDEVVTALMGPEQHRDLTARVEHHDRRLATAIDALADPLLADVPAVRPDPAAAQVAAAAAHAVQSAAVARQSRVHAAHERIDQLAIEHRTLLAELVPLQSEADLYEAVANRCAGKAAPKISLQRWVLATYLEAICEHANRRLVAMTAGRYQLRVEREGAHAAAKAGLDLWVLDAHTGRQRPVSTLSGGETFQTSLALALGVADSVEARTGGVRLDALFVDEGFGTLDPESLQLALDELDELRSGGRMVGVISHVGALRDRIRQGIEVTATDHGSAVRVGRIDAA